MKRKRLNYCLIAGLFLVLLAIYLFLNIKTNSYPWHNNIQITRHSVDYALGFASFSFFLALLIKKSKYLKYVAYVFIVLMFVNVLISISVFYIYKEIFNREMAYSIMSTSYKEASNISSTFYIPIFFSLIYIVFFSVFIEKLSQVIKINTLAYVVSILWIVIPIFWAFKEKRDIEAYRITHPGYGVHYVEPKFVFQTFPSFYQGINYLNEIQAVKKYKPDFSLISKTINYDAIDKVVVVVGESARKQNMSLYGYGRKTTPFEDKEKSNMFLYTDAVSPAFVTFQAVPLSLSSISMDTYAQNNFGDIADNIINVGRHFNRKTYWITGSKSEPEHILAYNAHQLIKTEDSHDGYLLPEFKKLIKNKEKQLIVLHLLGSHFDAKNNYPKTHTIFKNQNSLDEYDNSIAYTDYLLGQVFEDLRDTNSAVLYYSDHGQAYTNEKFFHAPSQEANMIPLFVWYGSKVPEALRKPGVETRQTSSTIVYDLVLELMGLQNSKSDKNNQAKFLKNGKVIPFNELKK